MIEKKRKRGRNFASVKLPAAGVIDNPSPKVCSRPASIPPAFPRNTASLTRTVVPTGLLCRRKRQHGTLPVISADAKS